MSRALVVTVFIGLVYNPPNDNGIWTDRIRTWADGVFSSQEFEAFLEMEGPHLEEQDIEKLRELVDWSNIWFINKLERDTFAVQSVLNQNGHGIILRGSGHQRNIENGLTRACLNSTNSLRSQL